MSSSDDEFEGFVRRSRVSLDNLDSQRYTARPAPLQPPSSSLMTSSSAPIPHLAVHDVPVIPLASAKPAPFLPPVWQSTSGVFTNPFHPDANQDFSQILASLPPEVANADLSVAGTSDFLGASRCGATLYLLTNGVRNAQEMAVSLRQRLQWPRESSRNSTIKCSVSQKERQSARPTQSLQWSTMASRYFV
jgi:hypothetical protein